MVIKSYIYDVATLLHHQIRQKQLCMPTFQENATTRFWSMGHLALLPSDGQVRNPLCLARNMIVTGPNAAGKTTYVRSICGNILLSQSFGVAVATKAIVSPVHAIGSFMRVSDQVGKASLFDAEVRRCQDLIAMATSIAAQQQRALFFLDEPMHSTPPTEGAATAIAVTEHLGRMPGIRVISTTHFHTMALLEQKYPSLFMNVSMEARLQENGEFKFPYRLCKGPSFQCIALELLQSKHMEPQVIQCAIEWKNKICQTQVVDDDS